MVLVDFDLTALNVLLLLLVLAMFAYAAWYLVENRWHGRTDSMEDPYQRGERR
jgi:HAMP domain-containing protein